MQKINKITNEERIKISRDLKKKLEYEKNYVSKIESILDKIKTQKCVHMLENLNDFVIIEDKVFNLYRCKNCGEVILLFDEQLPF